MSATLPPEFARLIESLARSVVADYLRGQATAGNDGDGTCTNPAALPHDRQAA